MPGTIPIEHVVFNYAWIQPGMRAKRSARDSLILGSRGAAPAGGRAAPRTTEWERGGTGGAQPPVGVCGAQPRDQKLEGVVYWREMKRRTTGAGEHRLRDRRRSKPGRATPPRISQAPGLRPDGTLESPRAALARHRRSNLAGGQQSAVSSQRSNVADYCILRPADRGAGHLSGSRTEFRQPGLSLFAF